MKWAVLTGDIIDSSGLTPDELDELMRTLDTVAGEISGWEHSETSATQSAFARRGGDGWQIAVNRPHMALRASLYVLARIRTISEDSETRLAVATGDGLVPDQTDLDLNSAHGDAFTASGRLLANLPTRRKLACATGGTLDAVYRLADHISQGWTQTQAQSVALMLPPGSGPRRVAAEKLGVSRQSVDQTLHAAGYPALEDALNLIEAEHD